MTLGITFFDKVKYKSTDFLARDSDFFGAGVVHLTDFPLTYPSTPNMTVNVGAGTAWTNGYRVANDSNVVTLTFNTADPTNPRIDIIEVGYTASTDANGDTTGSPVLQVKQGVAAASPIEPGADPGFVKLYAVSIAANQTTVTAADVTDRRALLPLNVDGSQITNFSGVTTAQQQNLIADLFGDTSVVLSGGVATKDGTVANQLDVTAANVYFSDGQHVNFAASQNGQITTATASTTYYLDYNPDGTTSWGTAHSTQTGYVPICSVTTDASGNISTVTDARPTTIKLFNALIGLFGLPNGAGFIAEGGAELSTGSSGGTWAAKAAAANADVFYGQDASGNTVFKVGNNGGAWTDYRAQMNGNTLIEVLSGGYKVQSLSSGANSVSANTALSVPVTFPVAYTSAPVVIVTANYVMGNSQTVSVTVSNITTTGCNVNLEANVAATLYFDLVAIGS
ncbi:H-type lectin domain-containing protein [Alicyclobacillus tolerans]|uniref:H-type lectin domain-containing protein n=1 Tax=Alicyclobacillus tolerans TaxID=90970 RepID=UPI001F325AA6|nr:H-type lectin domain-containing protein [Alicyclobacillus tolerans]MCF8566923.1 H-type lectin domain-containing protein [Alicyclobacillus tolerans]